MSVEYEVRPLSEMPPSRVGAPRRGFSQALRDLDAGAALFVPRRQGETSPVLLNRVAPSVSRINKEGSRLGTRQAEDGIWVYHLDDGGVKP